MHVNAVRVDLGSIATLPLGTTGNRLHSSCFLWDNVVVGKQLSQSIRGLGRDDQRRRLPISKLLFQCHRYFRLLQAIFFFTRIILGNIYICGMERVSKLRKLSDKFIEYVVELPTFRLHGLLQLSAYRSTRRIPVLRQLCRSTRNSESHPCRIGYIQ